MNINSKVPPLALSSASRALTLSALSISPVGKEEEAKGAKLMHRLQVNKAFTSSDGVGGLFLVHLPFNM